jgi:D-glycero-alpha-D-manno-heptose 1-phosphate guanylyltransferase
MTAGPAVPPCVVLAGGLGTRLRSVLPDRPKCLAPVGSSTFLHLLLQRLEAAGIHDFVLSLGHLADQVVDAIGRAALPRPPRFIVEDRPLGTGGAVLHVLRALGLDEVLVANGDTWLDGDLSAMLAPLDRAGGELFRLAAVMVPDRARFGGIRVDDRGRVTDFLEKGSSDRGLINAGLYRLCLDALPAGREGAFSLEQDVLPSIVAARGVRAAVVDGAFIDIGVPEDYRRFVASHG